MRNIFQQLGKFVLMSIFAAAAGYISLSILLSFSFCRENLACVVYYPFLIGFAVLCLEILCAIIWHIVKIARLRTTDQVSHSEALSVFLILLNLFLLTSIFLQVFSFPFLILLRVQEEKMMVLDSLQREN